MVMREVESEVTPLVPIEKWREKRAIIPAISRGILRKVGSAGWEARANVEREVGVPPRRRGIEEETHGYRRAFAMHEGFLRRLAAGMLAIAIRLPEARRPSLYSSAASRQRCSFSRQQCSVTASRQ